MLRYHPINIFDQNPLTAWNGGTKGSGIGESVEASFLEIRADEISIMPGYFDLKWFEHNNRIRELKITLLRGESEETSEGSKTFRYVMKEVFSKTAEFQESMIEQTVDLGGEIIFSKIIMEIKSVFRGATYDDTCISEVSFYSGGNEIELNCDQIKTHMTHNEKEIIQIFEQKTPSGYMLMTGTMRGLCFSQYYFPDGTFVSFSRDGSMYALTGKYRFGRWKMTTDNFEIEIHISAECGVEGIG